MPDALACGAPLGHRAARVGRLAAWLELWPRRGGVADLAAVFSAGRRVSAQVVAVQLVGGQADVAAEDRTAREKVAYVESRGRGPTGGGLRLGQVDRHLPLALRSSCVRPCGRMGPWPCRQDPEGPTSWMTMWTSFFKYAVFAPLKPDGPPLLPGTEEDLEPKP